LAAKALNNLGVEIGKVRQTIESVLGRNERIVIEQITPTSRVKKVIEISFEESRRMGNDHVGTEHLLLGLLIEGEGIAAHVLEDLGATLQEVRAEIERLLHDGMLEELTPGHSLRSSPTPVLDHCGRNITDLAWRNQLDAVRGRDSEVARLIEILSQQHRNSVLIVGEPDIRRSVLAGLALKIAFGLVPKALSDRQLKTLDPAGLLKTARARGDFKRRLGLCLSEIIEEVTSVESVLLIVDDIDVFFGGGDGEWTEFTAAALSSPIITGQIQCIACATSKGYERYVRPRSDLDHSFEVMPLGEATLQEAIEILGSRSKELERYHLVVIPDETIAHAAHISNAEPTRAHALLDRAASQVRRRVGELPDDMKDLQKDIGALRVTQDEAVTRQDFEAAAKVRDQVKNLQNALALREATWRDAVGQQRPEVTPGDVIRLADDDVVEEGRTD